MAAAASAARHSILNSGGRLCGKTTGRDCLCTDTRGLGGEAPLWHVLVTRQPRALPASRRRYRRLGFVVRVRWTPRAAPGRASGPRCLVSAAASQWRLLLSGGRGVTLKGRRRPLAVLSSGGRDWPRGPPSRRGGLRAEVLLSWQSSLRWSEEAGV